MPKSDGYVLSAREMNVMRQEAMASAGIGLYRYTFDGDVLYMDAQAFKILELDHVFPGPASVAGRNISELIVYAWPAGSHRSRVRREGEVHDLEYPFTTLRGNKKWLLQDSYRVHDLHTGEESIQVVLRDITARKRMEDALQESQQRLAVIMSNLPGMAYRCRNDKDWTMEFVSEGCLDLTGYQPSDLIENRTVSYAQLICPEDRDQVWSDVEKALDQKNPYRLMYRILTASGRTKWVWEQGRGVFAQDGALSGLDGLIIDITKHTRIAEQLWIERDLGVTLSSISDHKEAMSRILAAALKAADIDCGGVYIVDQRNRDLNLVFHQGLSAGFAAAAAHYKADSSYTQLVLAGEPRYESFRRLNKRMGNEAILVEDGLRALAIIPVQHQGQVVAALVAGSHTSEKISTAARSALEAIAGQIGGFIMRARAEEALRQSGRFLATLFASIQDGICVLDTDLTILRVNAAVKRWYSHAMPLVGKKCYQAYHGRDVICDVCPTLRAINSGKAADDIVPRIGEGGKVSGRLELYSYPLFDAETGQLNGVVEFVRDITERAYAEEERRKLEVQVQQAQKLESLGVMAGGIAHDFNNLLTGILGNAELALDDLPIASKSRESVTEIGKSAKRAADLCRQMLAYSGKGRFVIEALNLNEVIEEMAHLVQASISKKVALLHHFADNLPPIEADATQIRQVVMNLITNASEAIGDNNGVITIGTSIIRHDGHPLTDNCCGAPLPSGRYARLEFSDTGCGMDADTQSRIFDPFYTTKFTGRGLGLSAVLGIVRGHRGAIQLRSEPGKGTTFTLLFPVFGGEVKSRTEETSQQTGWRGNGVILVADDEEAICSLAQRILERTGFDVLTARDGSEAVDVFREHAGEIALVLLDLTMPQMNGEEALSAIRGIRPDARVILSSGYSEEEVTALFAGQKLAGFIQKPYGSSQLIEKVRVALGDGGGG